ncbi:MAG: hypothetical protein K6G80_03340 [Treponema sp.]|nr:hypothetical protein [Treponema sp.]
MNVVTKGCGILLAAFTTLAVLPGCKEKELQATGSAGSAAKAKAASERVFRHHSETVLYADKEGNGASLCTENEDGKMVWADEALTGDEIVLFVDVDTGKPDEKKAIRLFANGKEEEMDFVRVLYFGKEYWTLPIFITNQKDASSIPAVIEEDSYNYSSTDLVNAKTTKITAGTFVAWVENIDVDGMAFVKILTYDWNTPYGKEGYVKKDVISRDSHDVLRAQVAQAMLRMKDLKPFVRETVMDAMLAKFEADDRDR